MRRRPPRSTLFPYTPLCRSKAWEDAKLEPLTPHDARHTCASYLAAAGLTPKEMQTAMGHADIRTTLNIYAKAVPGWEQRSEEHTSELQSRQYLGCRLLLENK